MSHGVGVPRRRASSRPAQLACSAGVGAVAAAPTWQCPHQGAENSMSVSGFLLTKRWKLSGLSCSIQHHTHAHTHVRTTAHATDAFPAVVSSLPPSTQPTNCTGWSKPPRARSTHPAATRAGGVKIENRSTTRPQSAVWETGAMALGNRNDVVYGVDPKSDLGPPGRGRTILSGILWKGKVNSTGVLIKTGRGMSCPWASMRWRLIPSVLPGRPPPTRARSLALSVLVCTRPSPPLPSR